MSIYKTSAYKYNGQLYETEDLAELAKKADIEQKNVDKLRWFIYDLAQPVSCRGTTTININYLLSKLASKETRDKFKRLMDNLC